jgi:glycosyltransferase involved in cell wall biosynthesis
VQRVKLDVNEGTNKILFSGFKNIEEWRYVWGKFFANVVDEVIVFSNSTKELFVRMYPVLDSKIKVVPHKIKPLAKVVVRKHSGINIAMLGGMNSIAKGHDVIDLMCKCNKDPNVRLVVIGRYANPPRGLLVTGKYNLSDLPKLIEKYDIDAVFIPSVCPETFSYTTAEAMSMALPVICYNLGAPAERVSKYDKGLVLSNMNPIQNLADIKEFIFNLKKEAK